MSAFTDGPIGIAGGGRLGQALGRLLHDKGEPIAAVACRSLERARAAAAFVGEDVAAAATAELPRYASRVLIAVPDDAIASVAATLAAAGLKGMALHTSGTLGLAVLEPLAREGVACGSLHPLQTVPSPAQGVTALPGVWFALSGDAPAAAWARRIVGLLGGRAFEISEGSRPLYHAGAVMACNFFAALLDAGITLFGRAGLGREEALAALTPLVSAGVANAFRLGPERALTGPFARGDVESVRAHWAALAGAPEPLRELYRAAARYTIDLARRSGLDETKASEIERLFSGSREQ
jgi:predicted short-subunit dehydrogenase-like oxidoreductase (DUF2520 family)